MYFSKVKIKENAKGSLDFYELFRHDYRLHQSIWQFFADHPDRQRDFLYRIEQDSNLPVIYIVSARKPDANLSLWDVECKEYDPKLKEGMHLAFALRVNPICTKRDENNKQHRHDVIMEAKTCLKREGQAIKSLAVLVQEEGSKWLAVRSERYGFTINSNLIRVDGYQQHRFFKGKGNFSTVDFNGVLTVTEPELFMEILYKGIGPAKAFGCGLMMVKRI